MKVPRSLAAVAAAAVLSSYVSMNCAAGQITVSDLLRFAEIGAPEEVDWKGIEGRIAIPSPDGTLVAVVVRHGNPEHGTNDAILLIYKAAEIFKNPRPLTLAHFASATGSQPLARLRWMADSRSLLFLGVQGEGVSQIYQAHLDTVEVKQLTHVTEQIVWSELARNASIVVMFSDRKFIRPAQDPACLRMGCRVTTDRYFELEDGAPVGSRALSVLDILTGRVTDLSDPESFDPDIRRCDRLPSLPFVEISPDGRYVTRLCELKQFPAGWQEYAQPYFGCGGGRSDVCAQYLMITDLRTGKTTRVSNAPFWPFKLDQARPLWIDGGRHMVLPFAVESLDGSKGTERVRRSSTRAALLFEPSTSNLTRIVDWPSEAGGVSSVRWHEGVQTLSFDIYDGKGKPLRSSSYKRAANGKSFDLTVPPMRSTPDSNGLRFSIEQSLDRRPVLVAQDPITGREAPVLDPNPWLTDKILGRVEAIGWPVKGGQQWRGVLYYPSGYRSGERYPLVIQTHGFESDRFSMTGHVGNFAGRALAAQNIFILQVDEKLDGVVGTPGELPMAQAGYEGAIDYLDGLGLIRSDKVGIQGWSRTGVQVGYPLTHSTYSFAAAALTASADLGWTWSLLAGPGSDGADVYGGSPFDEGLKGWLEDAPTFNLRRVQAPMLLLGNGTGARLWDWYAGLRALKKPVEYSIAPDGGHIVYKATQRLKNNQLLVDWFRFWLKQEERSEVVLWGGETTTMLAGQYARWRALRQQQDEVMKHPRPPLLKWSAQPVGGF